MAGEDFDLGQLSSAEQEALQQYTAVTNQEVGDAVPLLQRSQWNVQIAISKFFDGEGPDLVAEAIAAQDAPRATARHENLQESLLAAERPHASSRRARTDAAPRVVPQSSVTRTSPWLLRILMAPFGWGWSAASVLFRTILYVLAFLPASIRPRAVTSRITTGFRGTNGRRSLMPRDTAARFKREFDEAYGENELPFFEGGVAQAHDLAKKELKFMLVVLMSPEHDDTETFVRGCLLSQEVSDFIKDPSNNIILWGGNVLDSEAYQVAQEYKCTKFPFSALVCLTPKEGSTRMGIVKRLAGPVGPSTYLSELRGAVEKYGTDLAGVRADRAAQEAARSIRTEQDSAYERSLAIDRERARLRRDAAAIALAQERRAREDAEAALVLERKASQWRTWRSSVMLPEPPASDKSVVRVAIKMPEASGAGRIVRRFPRDAPLEELYAFVECYPVLHVEGDGDAAEKPSDYKHVYRFQITSVLPRVVFEPSSNDTIGDKIGRSGNVIVEEPILSDPEEEEGEDDGEDEDEDEEEDEVDGEEPRQRYRPQQRSLAFEAD